MSVQAAHIPYVVVAQIQTLCKYRAANCALCQRPFLECQPFEKFVALFANCWKDPVRHTTSGNPAWKTSPKQQAPGHVGEHGTTWPALSSRRVCMFTVFIKWPCQGFLLQNEAPTHWIINLGARAPWYCMLCRLWSRDACDMRPWRRPQAEAQAAPA